MAEFASHIHFWNDWIVFPAMLIGSIFLHMRQRRHSTLVLSFGLGLIILGQVIGLLGPVSVLHPVRITGLVLYIAGIIVASVGFWWFFVTNRSAQK